MDKQNSSTFRFFFIESIFSTILLLLFISCGFIAYNSMIKESYPDLEIPQALILTFWDEGSPELMEEEITNQIEEKIKSIKGLKRYRSGSSRNLSIVSVEFTPESKMIESMQLLRSKVSEAESYFPKGAKKPYVEPIAVGDYPILSLSLSSENTELNISTAAKKMRDQIKRISGIKKVEISGINPEVLQVKLDPHLLREFNLSPLFIQNRILEDNLDVDWGRFENEKFKTSYSFEGRFTKIAELEELPILRREESRLIRLKDLAHIEKAPLKEEIKSSLSSKGKVFRKTIALDIFKLPGKDTIALIRKVKQELEGFKSKIPDGDAIQVSIAVDESKIILRSLKTVFSNCWGAMIAVFIVLLLMLTWREALIAGIAVPITFLGSILVLWWLGHSINELVIIGMVLALGLLVDDFILMVEGLHEAIYIKGYSFIQSTRFAISTYALPSFSGSITTIIVMLPMMMIGGVDGKFIRIIPITTAICLTLSYLVSIFILVPLSKYILRPDHRIVKRTKVDLLNEMVSSKLNHWLSEHVVKTKKRAMSWFFGAIILLLFTAILASTLPSELYPKEDGRHLGVLIELEPEATIEKSTIVADLVGEVLRKKTYFESVTKYIGTKSPYSDASLGEMLTESSSSNLIGFTALFVPLKERDKMGFEYVDELRNDIQSVLNSFPNATLILSPEEGGATEEDPIQIEIKGPDEVTLSQISKDIQQVLRGIEGARDVRDNTRIGRVKVSMTPKRESLDFYGITIPDLAAQMRLYMSFDETGKLKVEGTEEDISIYMGIAWPSNQGELGVPKKWEELESLRVINQQGERIPLGELVEARMESASLSIIHKDGQRTITVIASNKERTAGEIIDDFKEKLPQLKENWPKAYEVSFGGEIEASEETYGSSLKAFIIGFLLVFSILAMLFGSFAQPFIILFSVPLALIGVFGGFFLIEMPFSFPAMIGLISLTGIVVNDLIIMIETMNIHLSKGVSLKDAAVNGVTDRLRPIISTTLTTTIGLVPLALSSPAWKPLCLAIIFGEGFGTLIAIFVVPSLFYLFTGKAKSSLD